MSNSERLIVLYDKLESVMTTKDATVESYDEFTGLIGIVLPTRSSLDINDSIMMTVGNDETLVVITEITNGIAYGIYGIGATILPGDIVSITYQAMTVYSYPIDAREGKYPLVEVSMRTSDSKQRTTGSSYAISVDYELMVAVESGKDETTKKQAMGELLTLVDKIGEFTRIESIGFSVGVMLNSEVIVGQINITV
jgi:hypothetical protein